MDSLIIQEYEIEIDELTKIVEMFQSQRDIYRSQSKKLAEQLNKLSTSYKELIKSIDFCLRKNIELKYENDKLQSFLEQQETLLREMHFYDT